MSKMGGGESAAGDFLKKRDAWLRRVADDTDLSHPTVRVGLHLAMRIDGREAERGSWPSTKTIAQSTGVSVRSVLRALDELEGVLKEGQVGYRYLVIKRKRNAGNTYWLNFFWE